MSRFDAIDEDGDNRVDVDEIANALKLDIKDAQKVLEKYDTDGNGYLDRQEFAKLKQKLIRDKMEKKPDYSRIKKHESIRDQLKEIKILMNKMLAIDPAGRRVLKVRASQRNLSKRNANTSYRKLNSNRNISNRYLRNQPNASNVYHE